MISYTKRYVNIISLIVTIPIYIFFSKSSLVSNKTDFNIHLISNIFKSSSVLVELNSDNINQDTDDDLKDIKYSSNINLEKIIRLISIKPDKSFKNQNLKLGVI